MKRNGIGTIQIRKPYVMRQLNDNSNNASQIDEEPSKRNTQRGPHCHATPRLELIKGSQASLTVTDVTEELIKKGAVSS